MEQQKIKPSVISIVILCYKEGKTAENFIRNVRSLLDARGLDYELVLVANYYDHEKDSPDVVENSRILRSFSLNDKRIVLVEKEKHGAFGWDMRSGIEAATGKNIAITDGDGQVPAEDIIRIYDILSQGGYDCVKTFRMRRDDGTWRGIISFGYNFLIKIMFPRVYSGDVNGKPKIFTREALQRLKLTSSDWFIDAEMVIEGSYLGFRFAEISANFNEMKHRKSYIRPMAILESIKNIILFRMTRMKELR
jgi:glycosyltransferase involved in cell wall biosynthesis